MYSKVSIITLLSAFTMAGCGGDSLGTGAKLSVDYFGQTDVVGFHFQFDRVLCTGETAITPYSSSANVNLVDGIAPGMVTLLSATVDETSKHLFADLFATLEPGCYDVMASPASAVDVDDADSWTASSDCGTASTEDVVVEAGATTDVVLLAQCVGDAVGALDVVVQINHPPTLLVEIDEKFNYECESVEVCVTAYDVDDDPIEIEFLESSSNASSHYSMTEGTLTLIGWEDGHRIWQQCNDIVTRYTNPYDYDITVYDLMADDTRFEDQTDIDASSSSLTIPIYTNWAEEPLCWNSTTEATEDVAGSSVTRVAGCSYTSTETFYCSGSYDAYLDGKVGEIAQYVCIDDDADGVEDDLDEEAFYPECE